jgi:hypothetical protein
LVRRRTARSQQHEDLKALAGFGRQTGLTQDFSFSGHSWGAVMLLDGRDPASAGLALA